MTEGKLRETWYFLGRLHDLIDSPQEFKYNLSAFVTSWRSVFDVLLYDYAAKYFGISREKEKVTTKSFEKRARAVKESIPDAEKLIDWYNKKLNILAEEPLWHLRVISVHRGGPPTFVVTDAAIIRIAVAKPSAVPRKTSWEKITPEVRTYIGDYPPKHYLDMCSKGYVLMKEIVEEAREIFK